MYISAIEDAIKGAGSIEAYIRTLATSEKFLTDEDREVRSSIERIMTREGNATDSLINETIASILSSISMGDVLAESIAEAVVTNVEFSNDMLLLPLLNAARSNRNFTVITNRSGWGSTIDVIVDMDSTAGTLGEYASGVLAVREKLEAEANMARSMTRKNARSRTRAKDPIAASRYWKNKIYLNTNQMWYESTMEERIRMSGSPAPYWKLLDSGNIGMPSDWGGISYPFGMATDFTGKTEMKIKKIFIDQMKRANLSFTEFANTIKARQDALFNSLDKISTRAHTIINTEITVVDKLISSYGDDLDVGKLKSVLDSIMRGEVIKTTAAGRIELTARGGHTKRVRPSLRSLIAGMR